MKPDSTTKYLVRRRQGVTHEFLDQRSLAMHREIAGMIRHEPELLGRAKETLSRWIRQAQPHPPGAFLEWQLIMNANSLEEILAIIERDDEEAKRLRQSSPFCGILADERRLEILEAYEAARS